jgi:mannose-6-phosphate isomerase-like protein (cupin superfamily)
MTRSSFLYRRGAVEYFFKEGCFITEWWNRPEDGAVSLARVRVERGKATRRHRLKETVERYLILEGKGRVEIGEETPAEVGPGDVVFIPAGVAQKIENLGEEDLVFLVLCTPRFTEDRYEDLEE